MTKMLVFNKNFRKIKKNMGYINSNSNKVLLFHLNKTARSGSASNFHNGYPYLTPKSSSSVSTTVPYLPVAVHIFIVRPRLE